jgi:hypothetical protein
MNSLQRSIPVIALAMLALTAAPLSAQTAPSGGQPTPMPGDQGTAAVQVPKPDQADVQTPVRGELIEVDSEGKSLSVMTSTGTKVRFVYTDKTEVLGATEGVAGLAAIKDAQVSVHFTEEVSSKVKTATRIEIQPRMIEVEPKS